MDVVEQLPDFLPAITFPTMGRYLIPPLNGNKLEISPDPIVEQTHVLFIEPGLFEVIASRPQTVSELRKLRSQLGSVELRN
ncbi:MAG TPA: hypothetical protein DCE39_08665 [Planctomycetaceae bacterium]|nr:hypothetical protein [Planctomycetaceae bacterium]